MAEFYVDTLISVDYPGKKVRYFGIQEHQARSGCAGYQGHTLPHLPEDDRRVKYRKITESSCKFSAEPFLYVEISRYLRGGKVKARLNGGNPGYALKFLKLGSGLVDSDVTDVGGWKELVLAPGKELQLPGEGYLIYICANGADAVYSAPEVHQNDQDSHGGTQ